MIDLTEITEIVARQQFEDLVGEGSWGDLAAHEKANIKSSLLPIIHRVAEVTERQVREQIAVEIRTIVAVGARPLARDAEVPTDFATDREWAAMLAEGSA